MAYITNFERLAMEKGMLQDARELLLDALEEKFRVVPEEVQGKLQGIEEREVLQSPFQLLFAPACILVAISEAKWFTK